VAREALARRYWFDEPLQLVEPVGDQRHMATAALRALAGVSAGTARAALHVSGAAGKSKDPGRSILRIPEAGSHR
jgi:hypothetical protein